MASANRQKADDVGVTSAKRTKIGELPMAIAPIISAVNARTSTAYVIFLLIKLTCSDTLNTALFYIVKL